MNIIETALRYQEKGFSVIPIRPKAKKPLIRWEKYQKEMAGPETIKEWARRWPSMNIAIVTGAISEIDVVDCDSVKGQEAVSALLPGGIEIPIAMTPGGGSHFYFKHHDGVGCATRFIEDTDLRGDGGYIVAPPSVGGNGKPYSWIPGSSLFDVDPPALPASLYKKISFLSSVYKGGCNTELQDHNKTFQTVTKRYMNFDQGQRDENLFHIANCLFKGGMPVEEIQQLLTLIAANLCNPPFPQREVEAKVKSAIKRCGTRNGNLAKDIKDWLTVTGGYISVSECDRELQIVTGEQKANRRVIFHRLVKDGILERDPKRTGVYRKVDQECETIDFLNASDEPFLIKWPFKLEEYAALYPKNIAVIAGAPNAGKTALVLNVAVMNLPKYKGRIRYVSSEMGATELKTRLQKFKIPLEDWQGVDFKERAGNFSDVLKPDWINIIDFYEISSDFWKIAEDLKRIYQKLEKGIAIVCLQKSPGKDQGRGGDFGLEKPRLYLNLDPDPPNGAVLEIRKGKNWAKEGRNPNRYKTRFKIVDGSKLIQQGDWFLESR